MFILYVDDDTEDQEFFCEAIKVIDKSIECIVVQDGMQALTLLSKATKLPDYIFTDINMPRMNGKMFLQNIKTNSKFKDIPVYVFTDSVYNADQAELIKLGVNRLLTKQSTLGDLIRNLQAILR
jgi:CheY-like chemotaxis protein